MRPKFLIVPHVPRCAPRGARHSTDLRSNVPRPGPLKGPGRAAHFGRSQSVLRRGTWNGSERGT